MDTSKVNDQDAAEQSLFPVSEEKPDETRRQISDFSKLHHPAQQDLPENTELQGSVIIRDKVSEHCRNGNEAMEQRRYERAIICFSKAIFLQPEQAELHVNQGEAYLQMCDFQSAAACYRRARFFKPRVFDARLAFIYDLQGRCLFDRGLFLEAMEAFRKAVEVQPECKSYKIRRSSCLLAAGRHADCLKELNESITESPSADLYVLRARVHKVMNEGSLCVRDVKSALTLEPGCREAGALLLQLKEASEDARQQAVLQTVSGNLQEALCLINTALQTSPEEGRLYLFRGTLYRRMRNFTSAIEDLVQAVELSDEEQVSREVPGQAGATNQSSSVQEEAQIQMALTYNDIAVQCFGRGLYSEATLLLNKAIMQEKSLAGLYLNRGDCFFKLGSWSYALLDYQQAEEMLPPDEPAVRLRLAVIYNTLGSFHFHDQLFQKAVDMFTLAIKNNPTVGRYYESRSKAFRKALNLRGAREDLVRLLVLDPSNPEVPPMFMSLFPGCSVSDVMSSVGGKAIRAELMETIQTWTSSSDPTRLSESVQEMSLTDENATSQTEEQTEAAKDPGEVGGGSSRGI